MEATHPIFFPSRVDISRIYRDTGGSSKRHIICYKSESFPDSAFIRKTPLADWRAFPTRCRVMSFYPLAACVVQHINYCYGSDVIHGPVIY